MTATLNTELNIGAPDDMYEALVNLHRDLTSEQSMVVNAKLILLLVNHIGDRTVIDAAMALARSGISSKAGTEKSGQTRS